jgi:hypothetical protein
MLTPFAQNYDSGVSSVVVAIQGEYQLLPYNHANVGKKINSKTKPSTAIDIAKTAK